MFDTLIFDLDGTLINSLEDLKDSTNYALKNFGYEEKSLEEIRNYVGDGVKKLIERALPDGINNTKFDECLDIFKTHYKSNMFNKTKPYPQIIDMLKELKKNNIKTGVVSNKFDTAVKEICTIYFGDLIDTAMGESKNIKKKPAPDSVLQTIKLLKSTPEKSVLIGDSEVDIQTAKNAGIKSIGVCWGFRSKQILKDNNADYIVETPEEIIRLILKK